MYQEIIYHSGTSQQHSSHLNFPMQNSFLFLELNGYTKLNVYWIFENNSINKHSLFTHLVPFPVVQIRCIADGTYNLHACQDRWINRRGWPVDKKLRIRKKIIFINQLDLDSSLLSHGTKYGHKAYLSSHSDGCVAHKHSYAVTRLHASPL